MIRRNYSDPSTSVLRSMQASAALMRASRRASLACRRFDHVVSVPDGFGGGLGTA